jgi:hypothetical protein
MAELGSRIFLKYGIAYLATTRIDGGPRIHPVCPAIVEDRIILGIIPDTPKRHDLERDGRCAVHGLPGPNDAEICVSGSAHRLSAQDVATLIEHAPANVRIATDVAMFEIDIQQVTWTTYQTESGSRPVPAKGRWLARRTV